MKMNHSISVTERRFAFKPILLAIAHTVDLVGVDDVFHGRRVGMLAMEIAQEMGWDQETQALLYDAGMLHDCGVSSTRMHRKLLVDLEWAGAEEHCIVGYERLKDFRPLAHLAPIVRYHHSRWEHLSAAGLDKRTALLTNMIYMTDRVDVLSAPYYADNTLLNHCKEIVARVEERRGDLFAPELVDALQRVAERESFWLMLLPRYVEEFQSEMAARKEAVSVHTDLSWQDIRQWARILARIIDAKSPFTTEHSFGVARLCRYLGEKAGLPRERCEMLEVAGLLHDIGKLQIPDEILESPNHLDDKEFGVMKVHSFATYRVLRQVAGLEEVSLWAAAHHESLDGRGYPFHLHGGELPLEARIINVADIFQALAQNRPYRRPMDIEHIMAVLQERATLGKCDASVVGMLAADMDNCLHMALSTDLPD